MSEINISVTDKLNRIWDDYQATLDCFKIAQRSIDNRHYDLLKGTCFAGEQSSQVPEQITKYKSDISEYLVLSLWAVFERHLFACLTQHSAHLYQHASGSIQDKIQKKIAENIEYWRIGDALDLFKDTIDAHFIGQVKQIKKYRDWLVYQNEQKGKPTSPDPQTAYTVLVEMSAELERLMPKE